MNIKNKRKNIKLDKTKTVKPFRYVKITFD